MPTGHAIYLPMIGRLWRSRGCYTPAIFLRWQDAADAVYGLSKWKRNHRNAMVVDVLPYGSNRPSVQMDGIPIAFPEPA